MQSGKGTYGKKVGRNKKKKKGKERKTCCKKLEPKYVKSQQHSKNLSWINMCNAAHTHKTQINYFKFNYKCY